MDNKEDKRIIICPKCKKKVNKFKSISYKTFHRYGNHYDYDSEFYIEKHSHCGGVLYSETI